MKTIRDLEIYLESRRLAIEVHKMSLTLPKFELYEEGGQIRRSSKSVTAMIVEGYGRRRYKPDFIKHFILAQAECDETTIHLDFLFETQSFKNESVYNHLKEEYDPLSKRINKFTQWAIANWIPKEPKFDNKRPATGNW